MLSCFIDEHIRKQENIFQDEIVVNIYVGFPLEFLNHISNRLKNVSPKTIVSNTGIDLEYILDRKHQSQLIANFDDLLPSRTRYWLTYEEFIVLNRNHSGIFYEILKEKNININIFKNNYFDEYPSISSKLLEVVDDTDDDDRIVESKKVDNPSKINSYFYSEVYQKSNIQYVKFYDIDTNDYIHSTNFFIPNERNIKLIDQELRHTNNNTNLEKEIENIFWLQNTKHSNEKNFEYLLNSIWANKLNTKLPIIVKLSSEINISEKEKQMLAITYEICEYYSIPFNIEKVENKLKKNYKYKNELINLLEKYWSSSEFRDVEIYENPEENSNVNHVSQLDILENIISTIDKSNESTVYSFDFFITAPTGSGKSLLFQLPAIYLAQKSNLVTIVVSPLIALINDQVHTLNSRGIDFAVSLTSETSLEAKQTIIDGVQSGRYSIIYLSPEMLLSYSNIDYFIGDRKIGLFVIDEAHLVTTWGRDFRVDYWFLGKFIKRLRSNKLNHQNFSVIALTATCVNGGPDDTFTETVKSLNMMVPPANKYLGKARRENIEIEINQLKVEGGIYEKSKIESTKNLILDAIDKKEKTIVYFPYVSQIKDMFEVRLSENQKKSIAIYNGQMTPAQKKVNMAQFAAGEKICILATKAFGMGVDIEDINQVIHHAPTGGLADYTQEIGRAARKPDIVGKAKIYFHTKDLNYFSALAGMSAISNFHTKETLRKIYEIYSRNYQNRNFLMEVDDFAHIFPTTSKAGELDQKVKSALLCIENDLLEKYGYNVIVVRPRNIFTIGYVLVHRQRIRLFLQSFGMYSEQVTEQGVNNYDFGPVFKINLRKLWEEKYSQLSFPQIKRKFFMKSNKIVDDNSHESLFYFINQDENSEMFIPRRKVLIQINNPKDIIINIINQQVAIICEALSLLHGRYFSEMEFVKVLNSINKNPNQNTEIANFILEYYSKPAINNGKYNKTRFLTKRRVGYVDKYHIQYTNYYQLIGELITSAKNELPINTEKIERYIHYSDIGPHAGNLIRLAYLINILGIGTYSIEGGENSNIFIRINDPLKVENLVRGNYENNVVFDIKRRFKRNKNIIASFFQKEMSSSQRWDYIENYFLGKSLSANIENETLIESDENAIESDD